MALESFIDKMSNDDLSNTTSFLKEYSEGHRISDLRYTVNGGFGITLEIGTTYIR